MTEERTFLQDGNVYVSNTRVIINGTTLGVLGAIVDMIADHVSGDSIFALLMCVFLAALGYWWYQSIKPTYHVMLGAAGGERQGMSSRDAAHVQRTTSAIAEAIVYRG